MSLISSNTGNSLQHHRQLLSSCKTSHQNPSRTTPQPLPPPPNLSATLILPTPVFYTLIVPNTLTTLRLGFCLPCHPLNPTFLTNLIAYMQHDILSNIASDDEDAFPGLENGEVLHVAVNSKCG